MFLVGTTGYIAWTEQGRRLILLSLLDFNWKGICLWLNFLSCLSQSLVDQRNANWRRIFWMCLILKLNMINLSSLWLNVSTIFLTKALEQLILPWVTKRIFSKRGNLNDVVVVLKCSYSLLHVIKPEIILYIKMLYVLFCNERAKIQLLQNVKVVHIGCHNIAGCYSQRISTGWLSDYWPKQFCNFFFPLSFPFIFLIILNYSARKIFLKWLTWVWLPTSLYLGRNEFNGSF